jgi:hypothetical protein
VCHFGEPADVFRVLRSLVDGLATAKASEEKTRHTVGTVWSRTKIKQQL